MLFPALRTSNLNRGLKNRFHHLSLITLGLISLFLIIYRGNHIQNKEISWDVLGYYLYLPSTFIHHDPLFTDPSWLQQLNREQDLAGTLYMVSTNDQGQPIYFFLMGMALFYLPFFLLAHLVAPSLGFPPDGFSMPYQVSLVLGGILYTLIGLIYLRKILRLFFTDVIAALVLILIVFGTNWIHHLTLKNLETGTILFMMVAIVVWHTIRWHEEQRFKHLLIVGVAVALATLVKPSEMVVALIPLLWNVDSWNGLKEKVRLLAFHSKELLLTISIGLLLFVPQMTYWFLRTGHLVYDSYKNPGVGLDLLSPHLFEVLFSFRKGWLIYTPLMVMALVGFVFLYRSQRKIFLALLLYFLLSLYLISSWTEWWYGSGFSIRPLITIYPVLAICMGYTLTWIKKQPRILRIAFSVLIVLLIALNQFQWWQLKHHILEPYRTTRAYYRATFLKTRVKSADRELLLVERSFNGPTPFLHPEAYSKSVLKEVDFKTIPKDPLRTESDSGCYWHVPMNQEFCLFEELPFSELTSKDHVWLKTRLEIRFPAAFQGPQPCLVMTMERKEGVYGYLAPEIKPVDSRGQWQTFELTYLTPEIRNVHDHFKCYLWKRGNNSLEIRRVTIERFQKE